MGSRTPDTGEYSPIEWNIIAKRWEMKSDEAPPPGASTSPSSAKSNVTPKELVSLINIDEIEILFKRLEKIVTSAPSYDEEINQLRKSLKKTVEQALRDELRGIVWDDLAKELRDDVESELREELEEKVTASLKSELHGEVWEELKKELKRESWSSLYKSLDKEDRKEIEEEIREKIHEELSDQVRLSADEVTDIKLKLSNKLKRELYEPTRDEVIKDLTTTFKSSLSKEANKALEESVRTELLEKIQLTEAEKEERLSQLLQKLEEKEKPAIMSILRDEIREELGRNLIHEVRRNLMTALRDSVIKDLKISLRNEVEGLLRTELTMDYAEEIAQSGAQYVGAIVDQCRLHIEREIENRLTKRCTQDAFSMVREVLKDSGMRYPEIETIIQKLNELSSKEALNHSDTGNITLEEPVYEQI